MLIGFTIVAAPLLFAIVNAAVQMNRLSNRSEQLVVHGMQGTRNNQRMFVEIAALERTARLYQILPNNELAGGLCAQSAAAREHARMSSSRCRSIRADAGRCSRPQGGGRAALRVELQDRAAELARAWPIS